MPALHPWRTVTIAAHHATAVHHAAAPGAHHAGWHRAFFNLIERPQRVLARDQLLDLARHRSANMLDRSVDTQVSRLRKKLEIDASDPKIIKTV